MNLKCQNCGNEDIDATSGTCRKCGEVTAPLAESPVESTIETEVASALLKDIEEAEDAMEQATTEQAEQRAYENWEKSVFRYYDKGFRIVTLIGFSRAGKTFFAHRLRHELVDDWTVTPPHRDTIHGTGMRIELTQLVHKDDHGKLRVIADCDGEAFRVAVEALRDGNDIDHKSRRAILITGLASAYILMLPAAELTDRKANPLTNLLVERFHEIIKVILALKRAIAESSDVRTALQGGLKADYVTEALQYEFRCRQPIHVLFAKADKLPKQEKHEHDPHMYAATYAKTLYRNVRSHFPTFRFDFVCAFEGHPETEFEVDYTLPSYGTVAAFDWVDGMIDAGPLKRRSTRMAMLLRRTFDWTFRKVSAKVAG